MSSTIVQKLRIALERQTRRQRAGSNAPSNCTIVVGKRMTPNGCESVVCLASRRPEERRQHRVVLPGLGPGDVIRAPVRFFEGIVQKRRLPNSAHCRLWRGEDGGGAAWVRPRAVACPHHVAAHCCTRCPWMGVAATASREIKAERLRRAVEPLFQLATPLVEEKVESTGAPVVLSPLQLRMPLQFLEPFDVPIVAHSIREMEFYFRLPQHEERPSASPEEVPSPSAGKFCISLDAGDTPDCFLCTLEQQRLLSSLNRWAERLPPPLQMCLRAVFVLQHPRDGATRSWECDFHVTLLLRRDSARFGEQSPLCGPSQPEGTLSFEEQQLVDAVLSAAPLAKRLGVATLCDDGSLCCLYPRPRRVDFTMASDAARAEVVSCAALHGPSGQSVTAALPFMHSSIATTLGAHDMTSLEQPSPSVWRHAMAMEAAGSLLLTFTDTLQYGGGTIVVLAGDESCPQRGVAACPPSSGARLLGEALSQWLFRLPNVSLVRVARKSERAEGKSPSVEIAGVTSEAEIPALWLCLVDSDADVAAVADIVEHSVALLQRESLVEPKRVVLVQLAVDGDFQLLATALQCAMRGLEGRFHLRVDSGAVDIDPWTAAAVGYAVVELSSSAVS